MRLPDWQSRLDAVIEAVRYEPYQVGVHDCFRLTCRVIEALTGVDRWPQFAGYRTRWEALERMAEHGSNFDDAADWFFGTERVAPGEARRGDIVMLIEDTKHLGVCIGAHAAVITDAGLAFVPLEYAICAWRIG